MNTKIGIYVLLTNIYKPGGCIMEYSKDIILEIGGEDRVGKKGHAKNNFIKFAEKHKAVATIALLCGILIVLDLVMISNFIVLLQNL